MTKLTCSKHGDYIPEIIQITPRKQIVNSKCPICIQEQNEQMKYANEKAYLENKLISANISEHSDKTLDNYCIINASHELNIKVCRKYVKDFKTINKNLILIGKKETNKEKTHLAIAVLREILITYKDFNGVYYISDDVFHKFRSAYSKKEDVEPIYKSLINCSLLVVDSLGHKKLSKDESRILHRIARESSKTRNLRSLCQKRAKNN